MSIDDVIARLRERTWRERCKQKIYNAFGEDCSMKLAEENRYLAELRDALLSDLMTGKLIIPGGDKDGE